MLRPSGAFCVLGDDPPSFDCPPLFTYISFGCVALHVGRSIPLGKQATDKGFSTQSGPFTVMLSAKHTLRERPYI